MKKFMDVILVDSKLDLQKPTYEVHVDMSGVEVGDGTMYALIFRELYKKYPEASGNINDFNAIIYIDNIMKASDKTLLNPALIGILVRDAIECARDNWKAVLTQSIEYAK